MLFYLIFGLLYVVASMVKTFGLRRIRLLGARSALLIQMAIFTALVGLTPYCGLEMRSLRTGEILEVTEPAMLLAIFFILASVVSVTVDLVAKRKTC